MHVKYMRKRDREMKITRMQKLLATILAVALSFTMLPAQVMAAELSSTDQREQNTLQADPRLMQGESGAATITDSDKDVDAEILGESPYKSPTDMGVNMAGNCIIDDEICREASNQEIIRRYYRALSDFKRGLGSKEIIYKLELLMKQADISIADRKVIAAAKKRAEETGLPAVAIEMNDGTLITGKTSDLLGSSAAALLNALKYEAKIDPDLHMVAPSAIEPIQTLKTQYLGSKNPRLHTDEILIALSMSAAENPMALTALSQLPHLKGCEVHSTVLLSSVDENIFKRLGMHLTCDSE